MNNEDSKLEDPIHGQIRKSAQLDKKKEEVLEKELIVRERRAENQIQVIEQNDKSIEIAKKTNYGTLTSEEIIAKQKENTDYMYAARNKMRFIHEKFDKIIPFFRKNLILVGGKTGEGKSTTVANIIREALRKPNEITGKKRRILVLTNEEKSEDVYNRVTCLIKQWHYVNHDEFTDEQVDIFNKYIELLSKDGMLTVIDDTYNGALGTTSTLEGVCQVFDNLIANKEYYDVVLIDYYQNVRESKRNPGMGQYEVQAALATRLDRYKNIYPAPIVILAMVKQPDEEGNAPFKNRIEGTKAILNVATCCVEMVANKEELCTQWIMHKSRFNQAVGKSITTGYDKGRYVTYDDAFKDMVDKMKATRERAELDKQIKHIEPPKEKK